MISKIKDNMWSLTALGVIVLALISTKGGLMAIMPLARLIIPLAILFFLFQFIKKKLAKKLEETLKSHLGPGAGDPQKVMEFLKNRKDKSQGPVIDLCPRCGSYLSAGHRCKT